MADHIPVSKVARAMKLAKAGVKVARNQVKHSAKKRLGMGSDDSQLHHDNARDLYDELSTLKGSALKMAQMLSQDQNLLPAPYRDQFQMAQYSAPPLSYPLIEKVFIKELGRRPLEVFDSFEKDAAHAASIGQVHIATLGGKKMAVKIQYPGVADSIVSDLNLAKPFAARLFDLSPSDVDHYFGEVKSKMLEETDYLLEARQGQTCSERLNQMDGVQVPLYYMEHSTRRILCMEYLEGLTMQEWLQQRPDQSERDRIGQLIWDSFDRMIALHQEVHADPHPGNFKIGHDGRLQILDFGCVKNIPQDFFHTFFSMMNPEVHEDTQRFQEHLSRLDLLLDEDSIEERNFYLGVYRQFVRLLGRPFTEPQFDFSDEEYFVSIQRLSKDLQASSVYKRSKRGRGSPHGLYVNRTYFSIYNLLNMMGAKVQTTTALPRESLAAGA